MEFRRDEMKQRLYEGFIKNYPTIPKWIIFRTVELASTPGKAFDALYDFKITNLPICWDFHKETWVREKGIKF